MYFVYRDWGKEHGQERKHISLDPALDFWSNPRMYPIYFLRDKVLEETKRDFPRDFS